MTQRGEHHVKTENTQREDGPVKVEAETGAKKL